MKTPFAKSRYPSYNRFRLFMLKNIIFTLIFASTAQAFEWHGHRGARGLYPENSIGGMKEALKFPVTTLEMDLVISKDLEVIVSHDPWMNRSFCLTADGKKLGLKKINLYQMTAEEIARFDCGSKYYKKFPRQQKLFVSKPLLKDLLHETEEEMTRLHKKISYSFEIKSSKKAEKDGFQPEHGRFADLVIEEILKTLPSERFIIQSFDTRVLAYIKTKYPHIRIVLLRGLSFSPKKLLEKLNFTPDYVSPDYRVLCKEHVNFFHQKGIKVVPFTINDKKTFSKVKKMNVDGILTDYPDLISNLAIP